MLPETNADIGKKSKGVRQRDRKRRYSLDFKLQVVKETLAPGASVSVVARRHDINANVVFCWRKEFREGKFDNSAVLSKKGLAEAGFLEVGLVDDAGDMRLLPAPQKPGGGNVKTAGPTADGKTPGLIEIETAGGVKLRLSGRVDDRALRRVLAAIRRLT